MYFILDKFNLFTQIIITIIVKYIFAIREINILKKNYYC